LVNVIFNWWIKSKFFAWWGKLVQSQCWEGILTCCVAKYNYVLAAGLDTGLAISALVIFFCITYPGGVFPDWWGENSCSRVLESFADEWFEGNTVYLNTADGNGLPWLKLPDSGMFGPANGTWH
jgi:hypothetical protein